MEVSGHVLCTCPYQFFIETNPSIHNFMLFKLCSRHDGINILINQYLCSVVLLNFIRWQFWSVVETSDTCMRYEGFTGVKIQIVDLSVLTLYSLVGSYQHFIWTCLILSGWNEDGCSTFLWNVCNHLIQVCVCEIVYGGKS